MVRRRVFLCAAGAAAVLIIGLLQATSRAADEAEPAERTTVLMTVQTPDTAKCAAAGKLLLREILRQAVLVSARDELGLPTRDVTLRETAPEGIPGTQVIDLRTRKDGRRKFLATLVADTGDDEKKIFEKSIPHPHREREEFDYIGLAELTERFSRKEFVKALRAAGLSGRPNREKEDVKPSAATDKWLTEMNLFSQYAALRELHELQRTEGESIYTLGALVRAYAHLGKFTSLHWSGAHRVFEARSLLYAQRLLHRDAKSAFALRHRAYAAAMCGLHAAALDDLAAADEKEPADSAAAREATPWVPLIEKLCRYDFAGLQQQPPAPELFELGALIAYLVVEDSNCQNLALVTGHDVLAISPENYYVYASMDHYTTVENRNFTTSEAPKVLRRTLPARLYAIPALPTSVANQLRAQGNNQANEMADVAWACGADRATLVSRLAAAGTPEKDRVEPSWETLGRLIEDITFLHAYLRVEFFQFNLGRRVENYLPDFTIAEAAVGTHPYALALRCTVMWPERGAPAFDALCTQMHFTDVEWPTAGFLGVIYGHGEARPAWLAVIRHIDDTAVELERFIAHEGDLAATKRLRNVSPYSPQGIAQMIKLDPKGSEEHLAEWDKDFGDSPAVLRELSAAYTRLKRPADARRCLERYIEITPDQWAFAALAKILKAANEEEQWKAVLMASLDQPDSGTAHADACVHLADYYLRRKDLQEAVKYADMAAEHGTIAGLLSAALCHEALGEWDVTEQLLRATAEQSEANSLNWFYWCRRTGRGDVETAQDAADQFVTTLEARETSPLERLQIVCVHLVKDERKTAYEKIKELTFDKDRVPFGNFHRALLADEQGDTATRDASLAAVADAEGEPEEGQAAGIKNYIALSKWMAAAYAQPRDAQVDVAALEKILQAEEVLPRVNLCYFTARFFYDRGDFEMARKLLERAHDAEGIAVRVFNGGLVQRMLREMAAGNEAKPEEKTKTVGKGQ